MCCVSPDEVCSNGSLHPPPWGNVIHRCSLRVIGGRCGGAAGPREEGKMEYSSSLSVWGWQGFSPTPSHSSNEVIKWMNEAWKETCCWGQCVPKMPLPAPQPFASLYFAVEDSRRKCSQEDEAISAMCLQHIYQSWVARMQPACICYTLVAIGLRSWSEDRWGEQICKRFI